jgi:hypothetical protein
MALLSMERYSYLINRRLQEGFSLNPVNVITDSDHITPASNIGVLVFFKIDKPFQEILFGQQMNSDLIPMTLSKLRRTCKMTTITGRIKSASGVYVMRKRVAAHVPELSRPKQVQAIHHVYVMHRT